MLTQNLSQLDQLKKFTTVVADTGDFQALEAYTPQDSTTNPSLILKAVRQDAYKPILDKAIRETQGLGGTREERVDATIDRVLVLFGLEILKIVPGRVSTELDARFSFDTEANVAKAREIIRMYEENGIDRERILVKIASTWEGLCAAKILQQEGIKVNMTLLFSLAQAVVAAENRVQLVSPFVGRILDWHKAATGKEFHGSEDPGVQSVTEIYNYFKYFDYPTEVMGASFRNLGEIRSLAGCDLLTISPDLLEELHNDHTAIEPQLSVEAAKRTNPERLSFDEKSFRWALNEDAMATEKLSEGIRKFASDTKHLADLIADKL